MPFFMSPAAFWGLLTILVLAGIYFFRRRSRTIQVSSLMFFGRAHQAAEGGRRLTRLQAPLIMFIEIAILVLLVFAAANPRYISGEKLIPVILILDDSLSMAVNEPESPRAKALAYLEKVFFSRPAFRFTIIKAGVQPEILGRQDMTGNEAGMMVGSWRCNAASADIFKALRYVAESMNPEGHSFVLTDHQALSDYSGKATWLAFGKPVANLAITAVSRYALGTVDRCFVEFSNFASQPASIDAEVLIAGRGEPIERLAEILPPKGIVRRRFVLKDVAAPVQVRINNDPVAFDNSAWLLPVRPDPVEVEIRLKSAYPKRLVEKAVLAAGLAKLVATSTQLVITDAKLLAPAERLWQFYLPAASQPAAFSGVVAVDKEHPLTVGMPALRAAWAIDPGFATAGTPLMTAAAIPLLTVRGEPWQQLLVSLNLVPEYSDLQKGPVWPVLFWNLLSWRQQHNPGPVTANFRSGALITCSLPSEASSAELYDQAGQKVEDATVWRHQAVFQTSRAGIYEIRAADVSWPIAINLCSAAESDMTRAGWSPVPALPLPGAAMQKLADVRWWFILPALCLLAVHQWLATRRRVADASF